MDKENRVVRAFGLGFLMLAVAVAGFLLTSNYESVAEPEPAVSADRAFTTEATLGRSMEPTIRERQPFLVDYYRDPKQNDIIIFDCLQACYYDDGDDNNGKYDMKDRYAKRLITIREDNCWWVEGDNKEHSWDSRSYGWVCPENRANVGVIVRILN